MGVFTAMALRETNGRIDEVFYYGILIHTLSFNNPQNFPGCQQSLPRLPRTQLRPPATSDHHHLVYRSLYFNVTLQKNGTFATLQYNGLFLSSGPPVWSPPQ
jgi:hypothetical protein